MYYLVQLTLSRSGHTTMAAAKLFHPPMATSTYLKWQIPARLLFLRSLLLSNAPVYVLIVIWITNLYFCLPALFFSCIISLITCTLWLHKQIFLKQKGQKCLEGWMTKSSGFSHWRCRAALVESPGFKEGCEGP